MTETKQPFTTPDFARRKKAGEPIVMTTAYDALFASLADGAGVDSILVGDSLQTVLAGEETTLGATVGQMIYHGRMVQRGAERALVVVDMPFLSYQVSPTDAVRNGGRILKETGAGAVKLEGGAAVAPAVEALVTAGVPVMGHLGYTPQSVRRLEAGRGRDRGRGQGAFEKLIRELKALENAGVFAIVLALIPAVIARRLTEAASVPTIGIGSGPRCDGQILMLHEMLGLHGDDAPPHVKRYAELGDEVRAALASYVEEVRQGGFPGPEHVQKV